VWIAANGIPAKGLAVCHRNNDKTDNRLANLYLATPEQNTQDAHDDGLISHPVKVSPAERIDIYVSHGQGEKVRDLMERYGVSRSTIYSILNEQGWTAHRIQQTGRKAGQIAAQADSPRYKQMGNAVTVPVVGWIAARLADVHADRIAAQARPSSSSFD
jgi:site-specific DNA-cytosine methylase